MMVGVYCKSYSSHPLYCQGVALNFVLLDPLLLCLYPWTVRRPPKKRSLCRLGEHQGYSLGVCCILMLMLREQQ
ncbi:hypothetical protein DPMN_142347 [Dreissena polymorpha]|uniref:Uncharacterized protein n=1 Tax=Dreissena polymorpha TaxID=45954 RepID=A0A9D4JIK4_DREPO|nr:hypothetical protein DPMN_142347 [Dreissena polymorpha]